MCEIKLNTLEFISVSYEAQGKQDADTQTVNNYNKNKI